MHQMLATVRTKERRYPGVAFFRDEDIDRRLFFGRRREAYDLRQLILAERLVVLMARSGVGKSSLINAGLMQPLRETGYFPIVVWVNSVRDDPLGLLFKCVETACKRSVARGVIDSYEPGDPADWNRRSLWHFMKTLWLRRGNQLLQPVLIIDQVEELFTLISDVSRKKFVDQLADLVRGTRPRDAAAPGDDREGVLSDRPPEVKVLLSIREDFLANLDEMAGRIPSILRARYRLAPLRVEEARLAIVEPAKIENPGIATPRFEWSDEAVNRVLDFLRQRRSRAKGMQLSDEVEPFQLQLICQHVEELAARGPLKTIELKHLGGTRVYAKLQGIVAEFYERCLTLACRESRRFGARRRLQRLCEHEFISAAGRRRLCEESSIVRRYRVPAELLATLVELRLIRKEERVGDDYYELTHDTLIDPIIESRRRRDLRRKRWGYSVIGLVAMLVVTLGLSSLASSLLDSRKDLILRPDVLATTPVRARIDVGDTIDGRLGFFERSGGGVVLDTIEVGLTHKVDMLIEVSSNDFDTFLLVRTSKGKVLEDDDSGEGLDSLLTVSTEDAVRIIVTSSNGQQTGRYQLSIKEIPWEQALKAREHKARELSRLGFRAMGELSIGASVIRVLEAWVPQAWVLRLDEPQSLRVTLSSEDIDPYLLVLRPPDSTSVSDDDSGDGLNSSIELCDVPPGNIRIIATSYRQRTTGTYALSVDRHVCERHLPSP